MNLRSHSPPKGTIRMGISQHLFRHLTLLWLSLDTLLDSSTPRDERGDVPGWVMITVMSAGLVGIIGAVAGDALGEMLRSALNSVK